MIFSSTRDLRLAASAAVLVLGAGCQIQKPQTPDAVNPTPITTDVAMGQRNWPQTAAVYPSLSSTTGPAGVIYVARDDLKPIPHAAAELPIFVIDTLGMPVLWWYIPPWKQVEGTSFYLPPTYTGNPPLDASRPDDFSGGPGTGWNPTSERTVHYTEADAANATH